MQKFVRAKISIAKESVSSDANFESFVDWSTNVFDFASHKSGNKWKLIQIFFWKWMELLMERKASKNMTARICLWRRTRNNK